MNIKLSKGTMLGIGVVGLIVLIVGVSSCKGGVLSPKKEHIDFGDEPVSSDSDISSEEREQARLVERYGEAPKGFRWDTDGSLIALGDDSLTAEEVAYTYLKSASLLDFEMLQKVADNSLVVRKYSGFSESTDIRSNFRKKMYKESLKSIKMNTLVDTAVYAENKTTFTFSINILDLTDKDFWRKDSETLFNTIFTYRRTEADTTKAKDYLYDYILKTYSSPDAPKHDVELEITVEKTKSGAWLVTDDSYLNSLCTYEDGEYVSDYILTLYDDWYSNKQRGR